MRLSRWETTPRPNEEGTGEAMNGDAVYGEKIKNFSLFLVEAVCPRGQGSSGRGHAG